MTIQFLEAALHELQEAIVHYDDQREGLGDEFDKEVNDALQRIIDHPEGWTLVAGNVRCCMTNRFPYGLMYVIKGESVLVVAVAHLHRKAGYWRKRLRELPG
jgi:plasmid stabilization system protein ParE